MESIGQTQRVLYLKDCTELRQSGSFSTQFESCVAIAVRRYVSGRWLVDEASTPEQLSAGHSIFLQRSLATCSVLLRKLPPDI